MKRRPAAWLWLSALGGAYCGYYIPAAGFFVCGSAISVLIAFFPRDWLRICAFLACTFFVTAWSMTHAKTNYKHVVDLLPSSETHFVGVIEDSFKHDSQNSLVVAIKSAGETTMAFTALVHLTDACAALRVKPGDIIELRGTMKPFTKPLSPFHFDGARYGFLKQIHAQLVIADPALVHIGKEEPHASFFAGLRATFRERINTYVSPREAALVLALLIGETHQLAMSDREVFRAIGAEHLLAVSGLQIGLLAWLCFLLFFPFISFLIPHTFNHWSQAATALVTIFVLFFFVGLSGFSQSAQRALLMAIFLFLPTIVARKIDSFDALYASGLISVLWQPAAALDLGFLLSYAAVFGILVAHCQKNYLHHRFKIKSILRAHVFDAVVYALAAFLATMPICVALFYRFSPASFIANSALVPFAAITQIPAMMCGLLGCIFSAPWLIEIAAFFGNLIGIFAEFLEDLMGTVVMVPILSPCALVLVVGAAYILLIAALTNNKTHACLGLALLAWPAIEYYPRDGLTITVIPVGQGDSTLFSFDTRFHLLIDAGGTVLSEQDPGALYVVPTLLRKGITTLDVLVISHPDPDHINGAFAVLNAIRVKEIWHSGFSPHHPLTKKLEAFAREKNISIKTTKDIFGSHRFGTGEVQVLAPRLEDYYDELPANDNSLVLRIVHGEQAVLWPGDLEVFGEHLLLAQDCALSATILKAPHHGSKTSSTERLIAAVNPQHVIFSTGRENRFHFPHEEVVRRYQSRGVTMWNTAVDGEITISIGRQKISIDGYQTPFKEKT